MIHLKCVVETPVRRGRKNGFVWAEGAKQHKPQLDHYITFGAKREEGFYNNISRAREEICKKKDFSPPTGNNLGM